MYNFSFVLAQEEEVYTRDPNSLPYIFSPTFFISFSVFLCCLLVISPQLAQIFIPEQYSKIGKRRGFFLTLLASTLHAIVVLILFLVISGHERLSKNLLFTKLPLAFTLTQITLGYMTGDFIFCLWDKFLRQDIARLVHHIVAMICLFLGLYHQGLFMYIGILILFFSEISTPFVNLAWVLKILDQRGTREFCIASIAMVTVYFFGRLVPLYWLWKTLVLTLMTPGSEVAPLYYKVCTVGALTAMSVLNVLWFWKMVKRGINEILKLKKKSK